MKNKRLYRIWAMMKQRCSNPRHNAYPRYGGRGITVCDEWQQFAAFEAWALANGYADDLSIERDKSDVGYCPGNCRWATAIEQQRNTSRNVNIEIHGRTQCAAAWAAEAGISLGCLLRRYHLGWRGQELLWPALRRKRRDVFTWVSHAPAANT